MHTYIVNLKFLRFILVNLFGAYDPRRPPNQDKRGTPKLGQLFDLMNQDRQYVNEST